MSSKAIKLFCVRFPDQFIDALDSEMADMPALKLALNIAECLSHGFRMRGRCTSGR